MPRCGGESGNLDCQCYPSSVKLIAHLGFCRAFDGWWQFRCCWLATHFAPRSWSGTVGGRPDEGLARALSQAAKMDLLHETLPHRFVCRASDLATRSTFAAGSSAVQQARCRWQDARTI